MIRDFFSRSGKTRDHSCSRRNRFRSLLAEALESRQLLTAGDLDPTFGLGGKVTTDFFGSGDDAIADLVYQSDGKLVAVGTSTNGLALARYNTDGSLDAGFGAGGTVRLKLGSFDDRGNAVAIQPDGKILVAGSTVRTDADFAVVRFLGDGTLDSSFGVGGVSIFDVGGDNYANDLAIQSDGKIVVGGGQWTSTTRKMAVARLNADGTLDSTFNSVGWVATDFGHFGQQARSVGLDSQGRIVAGMSATRNTSVGMLDFAAVRYTSSGTLDSTFGSGGLAAIDFSGKWGLLYSAVVQADDRVVLAGTTYSDPYAPNTYDFALVRFTASGALDSSFGANGQVFTDFAGYNDIAYALALQADGKLVAVGVSTDASGPSVAVARYLTNGALDTSFDGDGRMTSSFGSSRFSVQAVAALSSNGRIAVGGHVNTGNSGRDFAVAALTAGGTLDSGFDGEGIAVTNLSGPGIDQGQAMLQQPDGKFVVVGSNNDDFAVARYNPDGSLDPSFGSGGQVTTDVTGRFERAYGVALQTDGKIVVVGSSSSTGVWDNQDLAVLRYHADGTLDTAFGSAGAVIRDINGGMDVAYAVTVDANHKIVVVGYTAQSGADADILIARFNADGTSDTSFGTGGLVITDPANSTYGDYAYDVAIDADGKIVVAGQATVVAYSQAGFAVLRYLSNGTLDTSFNGTGVWAVGRGHQDYARALALRPDGKILLAGTRWQAPVALVQLLPNGTLDTSFGTSGEVFTTLPDGASAGIKRVSVQADGKIAVAGTIFLVLRYSSDGVLDNAFGAAGMVQTDFQAGQDNLGGMVIQADGSIVVAGTAQINATGLDFALVRYRGDDSPPLAGDLDPSFDSDGKVTTLLPDDSKNELGYAAAVQDDGKVVVVGYADSGPAIARYHASGGLDHSFGEGGKIAAGLSGSAWAVAIQPDGKIVVTGGAYQGATNEPNVRVDTSFGDGGKVKVNIGGSGTPRGIAIQPDGKIVVAGDAYPGGDTYGDFGVLRLNADGTLDATFGAEGLVTTAFPAAGSYEGARDVALQSDGKIVVVGVTDSGGNNDMAVVRYNSDGSLDATFGAGSSQPRELVAMNGVLYFTAYTPGAGVELWRSDGTDSGTFLLKDIRPGSDSSSPKHLTVIGGTLYFQANNGTNGVELWKSNGTADGTMMVKDISPGSSGSSPTDLVDFGGVLFFRATDGANGVELWRSDGTADGTQLVKDINPGSGSSSSGSNRVYTRLVAAGGTLFFAADDGVYGSELWKSDGTGPGTMMVKEIRAGSYGATVQYLTAVGSSVFFSASTEANGFELWKSDGTDAGTKIVKEINPGAASASPGDLLAVGTALYFQANDGVHGNEVWVTDGSEAGTRMVADIYVGSTGSFAWGFADVGGTVFFKATDPVNGRELWKTDGTAANTVLVANIRPDSASSSPENLTNVNGTLFFEATDGTNGRELWKSNGTAAGTMLVKDINAGGSNSSPTGLTAIGSTVYFAATDDVAGEELWKSNGSSGGTVRVKDIVTEGFALVTFDPGGVGASAVAESVAIQPDGKIVVGGWQGGTTSGAFQLARLNPNGTLDATFGSGGTLSRSITGTQYNSAYDIALQPDGKIVQVGGASFSGDKNFVIWRYHPDGTTDEIRSYFLASAVEEAKAVAVRDDGKIVVAGFSSIDNVSDIAMFIVNPDLSLATGFSSDGLKTTDFYSGLDSGRDVLVQPDGRIVLAGTVTDGTGRQRVGVSRYTTRGDLDTTFNTNGTTSVYLGTDQLVGEAAALQADGKLLVAGRRSASGRDWGLLVRLDAGGLLDPTFDGDGVRYFALPGTSDQDVAYNVAVQTDGKIIAAGASTAGGNSSFSVYRFLADGQFDSSFGNDGGALIDFGSSSDIAWSAAIQPDGKIVVAGESGGDVALARLNADGTPDTSFDTDGRVTTDFAGGVDRAYRLALQPDGKILLVGEASGNVALARYNPDGSLDTTFGAGGRVTTDFGTAGDIGRGLVLQADGKIVVTGESDGDFISIRYHADGSRDLLFGQYGKVRTDFFGYADGAYAVAVQADGNLVVAGSANSASSSEFALARYNPSGELDTTFNRTGGFDVPGTAVARAVTIQPDGKIVVAGESGNDLSVKKSNFSLVRYRADGSLDADFGFHGAVRTDFAGDRDVARDVVIQPDGKILVAGNTLADNGTNSNFAVARYAGDGRLDIGFGLDGLVTTDLGGSADQAEGIAWQSDGKAVVVGTTNVGGTLDIALVRYLSNGQPDASFGTGGMVVSDLGGGYDDAGYDVAIQADGKILVAGVTGPNANRDFALVRYNANGTLDTGFGTGGLLTTDFGGTLDSGNALAIQSDGKIVVVGKTNVNFATTNEDFALARFHPDGTLDATFGTGGKVITDFGSAADAAHAVAIFGTTRIVVAGRASNGSFGLASYLPDGTLETRFGSGGKATAKFGSGSETAYDVALQADGKIVMAGEAKLGGKSAFGVARYLVGDPPVADAGGPYTGNEGSDIPLDGSGSTDPADNIVLYEWDLDNDGTFEVTGVTVTFNSTADGVFTVVLRVTDADGAASTDTATVTVQNVIPTADAGGPYSGAEGSSITLTAAGSFDPGNDIVLYEWDLDYDGSTFTVDATGVTATFNAVDDGIFTVAVRVTDDGGASSIATATVTIGNVAPALSNLAVTSPIDEGSTVHLTGTISDPGTADSFVLVVDWGDGSAEETFNLAAGTTAFDKTHVYANNGAGDGYTIVLRIRDDDSSLIAAPANLLSWWPGDGSAEDVQDSNTGTPIGGVSYATGKYQQAFSFDGIDGRITGTLNGFAGGNAAIALAAWFNADQVYGHPGKGILGVGGTDYRQHFYMRLVSQTDSFGGIFDGPIDDQNRLWLGVDSGGSDRWWGGSSVVQPGHWYHVAATYDPVSREVKTYLNGVLERTATLASDLALTNSFFIGGDAYNDNYFDGLIDEPKVFTRTLSAAEIQAEYEAGQSYRTLQVVVRNVAPVVSAGANATIDEGSTFTGTGSFTDPRADTWTATVDYGDGSGVQPLTLNADKTFALSHRYAADGTYVVSVTVTDSDGDVGTGSRTITVNNVAPTADAGGPYFGNQGSDITLSAAASSDPGNDIAAYEWDLNNDGTYDATGVTATFNSTVAGTHTVVLRVTDDEGAWNTDTATVVINASPIAVDDAFTVAENATLQLGHGWIGQPTLAAMPSPRSNATTGVIDGRLYVVSGSNSGGDTPVVERYDPRTNTWSTLAPLPDTDWGRDGRYGGTMGVIGGKLYLAGGWRTSPGLPTTSLFIYDPATDAWSQGAAMPLYSGGSLGGVIDGKLYVHTPYNGYSGTHRYFHVYDPATNAWTRLADSPHPHGDGAAAVIDGKLYAAGGGDDSGMHGWLDVYDPATNTWTTRASMPTPRYSRAGAALDGKFYVLGGWEAAAPTGSVYVYDPATDAWSIGVSMPTARSSAAAAVLGQTIHVVGGSMSSGTSGALEAMAPALVANDSDPDGGVPTITRVDVLPGTRGTVTLSGSSVTYDPNGQFDSLPAGASATDTFTYTVSDVQGGTGTATVAVTVTGVNDAPAGADNTVTTVINGAYTFVTADFGFTDPVDSPPDELLAVQITRLPAAGSLLLNGVATAAGQFVGAADIAGGKLTFAPTPRQYGGPYTSFTFQVQDDGGTANGGLDLDPIANVLTINVTLATWHNTANPWDVDDSGNVAAADVLALIDYINTHPDQAVLPPPPEYKPHPFYDVNGDGRCTPLDALIVINYINHRGSAGEGEVADDISAPADAEWANSSWPPRLAEAEVLRRSLSTPDPTRRGQDAPPVFRSRSAQPAPNNPGPQPHAVTGGISDEAGELHEPLESLGRDGQFGREFEAVLDRLACDIAQAALSRAVPLPPLP